MSGLQWHFHILIIHFYFIYDSFFLITSPVANKFGRKIKRVCVYQIKIFNIKKSIAANARANNVI